MLMRALTIRVTTRDIGVKTRRHLDGGQAVVFRLCEGVS